MIYLLIYLLVAACYIYNTLHCGFVFIRILHTRYTAPQLPCASLFYCRIRGWCWFWPAGLLPCAGPPQVSSGLLPTFLTTPPYVPPPCFHLPSPPGLFSYRWFLCLFTTCDVYTRARVGSCCPCPCCYRCYCDLAFPLHHLPGCGPGHSFHYTFLPPFAIAPTA